jgi:hypothetical protein
MLSWLLFGGAIYLGLKTSDARREVEVLKFWRIYDFKLRRLWSTPFWSDEHVKLEHELSNMHPPSEK